mmetsp:Transcript_55818/g.161669  ORF Transcript_55818/g.161669 Transcript_55818/m.161669 type:complete len:282 (+) Transcript_55818:2268-3113(+)
MPHVSNRRPCSSPMTSWRRKACSCRRLSRTPPRAPTSQVELYRTVVWVLFLAWRLSERRISLCGASGRSGGRFSRVRTAPMSSLDAVGGAGLRRARSTSFLTGSRARARPRAWSTRMPVRLHSRASYPQRRRRCSTNVAKRCSTAASGDWLEVRVTRGIRSRLHSAPMRLSSTSCTSRCCSSRSGCDSSLWTTKQSSATARCPAMPAGWRCRSCACAWKTPRRRAACVGSSSARHSFVARRFSASCGTFMVSRSMASSSTPTRAAPFAFSTTTSAALAVIT